MYSPQPTSVFDHCYYLHCLLKMASAIYQMIHSFYRVTTNVITVPMNAKASLWAPHEYQTDISLLRPGHWEIKLTAIHWPLFNKWCFFLRVTRRLQVDCLLCNCSTLVFIAWMDWSINITSLLQLTTQHLVRILWKFVGTRVKRSKYGVRVPCTTTQHNEPSQH